MKRSRFTATTIVSILKEADFDRSLKDAYPQHGKRTARKLYHLPAAHLGKLTPGPLHRLGGCGPMSTKRANPKVDLDATRQRLARLGPSTPPSAGSPHQ